LATAAAGAATAFAGTGALAETLEAFGAEATT